MDLAPIKLIAMVEGGGAIGLGHVMRSLQFAKILTGHGVSLEGFIVGGSPLAAQLVERAGYTCEFIVDAKQFDFSRWIDDKGVKCLFVDQLNDVSLLCRRLKREIPGLFTMALDPPKLDSIAFNAIVQLFHHGIEERVDFEQSRYFEGLQYALLRDDFLQVKPRVIMENTVGNVLVSFGGTDPSRSTVKVLKVLEQNLIDGICFHIVIGPGFGDAADIRESAEKIGPKIKLHENVQNMPALMMQCELGIISAGSTLMEMCYLGIPSLTIAHNSNELRFARYFQELGATVLLGAGEEVRSLQITREIRRITEDAEKRRGMAREGMAVVDGRGGERLANVFLRELQKVKNG